MTTPTGVPAFTPRNAVEQIFHRSQGLQRFVITCRDSLLANMALMEGVTKTKKAQGEDADFGLLAGAIEQANKVVGYAFAEDVSSHSYLYGLATIRLWTALESGVHDLLLALLEREERWRTLEPIKKLKVSVGDFASLSGREVTRFLLKELQRETRASSKAGVGAFEHLLNAVGCGGPVHGDVAKAILELGETRHVLVHRDGRADEKFKNNCPWVPLWGIGVVRVTPDEFILFSLAVMAYMAELMVRLQDRGWFDGEHVDWQIHRAKAQADVEKAINLKRPTPVGDPEKDQAMMIFEYLRKKGEDVPDPPP